MRVLHVVNGFSLGGMENGVVNLTTGLLKRSIESDICVLTEADGFARRLDPSVKLHVLQRGDGLNFEVPTKISALLKTGGYHALHTHNWTGLIYGVLPARLRGVPVMHGEHAELFEWEKKPLRLALRWLLYRLCHIVHTVSEGQMTELRRFKLLKGVKAAAIPNGTNTDLFRPGNQAEARARLQIPTDAFCIGMVGRFAQTKRHGFMLDAFFEAAKVSPSLHLVIAGSGGPLESSLRERCAGHPQIHWLGGRDDMPEVYRAFDLLVIPSVNEGMANVALEAMASGVPVLANAVCGMSEVITHDGTGLIVPMESPSELVATLQTLMTDLPRLRRLGEAARQHILNTFSIDSMLKSYEDRYRSLVPTTTEVD